MVSWERCKEKCRNKENVEKSDFDMLFRIQLKEDVSSKKNGRVEHYLI